MKDESDIVSVNGSPKIETFEHDIKAKIDSKNSTVADIAAAGGTIGNNSSQGSLIAIAFSVCFILLLGTATLVILIKNDVIGKQQEVLAPIPRNTDEENISLVLPNFYNAVGGHAPRMQKMGRSFVIQVSSFKHVYSYLKDNEEELKSDMINVYGLDALEFSSNLLLDASTSEALGTTTLSSDVNWEDLMRSNQNMRVLKGRTTQIIYGFLDEQTLVITYSPDALLLIRDARKVPVR